MSTKQKRRSSSRTSAATDRASARQKTMDLLDPADLYTVAAAAAFLRIDNLAAQILVDRGYIPAIQVECRDGGEPIVLIPAESIRTAITDLDSQVGAVLDAIASAEVGESAAHSSKTEAAE